MNPVKKVQKNPYVFSRLEGLNIFVTLAALPTAKNLLDFEKKAFKQKNFLARS